MAIGDAWGPGDGFRNFLVHAPSEDRVEPGGPPALMEPTDQQPGSDHIENTTVFAFRVAGSLQSTQAG